MFAASKTDSASTGGYQISRSLRFNSADSAYLNRTPASTTNQKTWTYSGWIKRSTLANANFECIFGAGTTDETYITFRDTDVLQFRQVDSSTETISLITTQVFRDVSAWYHIVVAVDTTQATSTNRIKIYLNGIQITAFGTATYPSQNANTYMSSTVAQYIGKRPASSAYYPNGYMTEVNFIDGQALTPSSFGETNAQTGVWGPKAYSGSYGTNGFYLNFSDNSNTTAATLGKDYSGNGNNWTPNNFSVTAGAGNDSLVDSPTSYGTDTGVGGTVRGNYCTANPLDMNPSLAIRNGNLDVTDSSGSWLNGRCTIGVSSGKWYFESTITSGSYQVVGIANSLAKNTGYEGGGLVGNWAYGTDGSKILNGVYTTPYGASYGLNDVIGVAFDADAGTLTMYKNGTSQGTLVSGLPANTYFPWAAILNATVSFNFGQRPFAYTAPSGFKALNTQNLPTPTIGATTATQAGKYFNTVLYTGTGYPGSPQSISGVGFQPDWTWVKRRSNPADSTLVDAVRGANKSLFSNSTSAEDATAGYYVTAFNSDGFSVDLGSETNTVGNAYVAWNWKANGSGSTNTAGSITSTVSANTTSGFSVVTYTGNGSAATIGHGLGVAPSMYIVKNRSGTADEWVIYHSSLPSAAYYLTFTTNSQNLNNVVFNSTAPTSTVFSVGTSRSVNATTYVAYCFAPVAGYSAFGYWAGNSSTDGPFNYCGFRPAYIMWKRTDSLGVGAWVVEDSKRDPINVTTNYLSPNDNGAEVTSPPFLDFLSNGFKVRRSSGGTNETGGTYIFMAFAEFPFKYSLAR